LREQEDRLFRQMEFGKWQINLANFTLRIGQISMAQNVGKMKGEFFPNTVHCLFLLDTQRLVKMTPGKKENKRKIGK